MVPRLPLYTLDKQIHNVFSAGKAWSWCHGNGTEHERGSTSATYSPWGLRARTM